MPTPVPAARQCLAPAAVAALDAAVASARRRAHAQTTSLHLVSALLLLNPAASSTPSSSVLRDAVARARSAAYSPRLQLKALDLCFAVSLDRLPSSSSSVSSSTSTTPSSDEPPVSNSLMAAIKRSQANQRRNPDTFHFYQTYHHQSHSPTASTSPTTATVKVDLSHLLLAVLDDPLVSRVFADAGFRSADIKLAILRPVPLLPARARPPPLFLCSFTAADADDGADAAATPSPAPGGDDNRRRISDILSRGRNPMLVGVGAASAAAEFADAAAPYRVLHVGPGSITHQTDLASLATSTPGGLIVSIGDLKHLVPDDDGADGDADLQNSKRRVVSEVTRLLETRAPAAAARVWVMGWSATYETYLAFLSKFPLVDKDWDLQLLPVTAVRPADAGVVPPATTTTTTLEVPFSKPPTTPTPTTSLMESFVPFGGFLGDPYEPTNFAANSCPQALRCQQCNDRYEQEVTTIIKGSGIRVEENQQGGGLPSLLQNGSMMGPNSGFDALKFFFSAG